MIMPASLDINSITGISEQEAAERLRSEGFNELPSTKQRSILAIAFDVVREPMFLLLVACGSIYLVLGDFREAMMLLGFVFVVAGITLYQERKTERALEALRDLSSPGALVIRDRKQKRIPGREVVRGDVIVLNEGDRVPADAALLSCVSLSIDESLLTGESVPVRKTACSETREMARPEARTCRSSIQARSWSGDGDCHGIGRSLGTPDRQDRQGAPNVELEETPFRRRRKDRQHRRRRRVPLCSSLSYTD
jgi:Ca2+-transporting ATPase